MGENGAHLLLQKEKRESVKVLLPEIGKITNRIFSHTNLAMPKSLGPNRFLLICFNFVFILGPTC